MSRCYRVITFDNRDIGQFQKFAEITAPNATRPTLVIHRTANRLIPYYDVKDIERIVNRLQIISIVGVDYDLPIRFIPSIVSRIAYHFMHSTKSGAHRRCPVINSGCVAAGLEQKPQRHQRI